MNEEGVFCRSATRNSKQKTVSLAENFRDSRLPFVRMSIKSSHILAEGPYGILPVLSDQLSPRPRCLRPGVFAPFLISLFLPMETTQATTTTSSNLLPQIKSTAEDMSGWLKFIGVVSIIVGVPMIIGLVGILYIWIGVLLYQAGNAAESSDTEKLSVMMNKLKTFFIITGILTGLSLLGMIIAFLTTGLSVLSAFM